MSYQWNSPAIITAIGLLFLLLLNAAHGEVWCYRCISNEPGCDDDNFDWRMHSAETCYTTCVKIIDMVGSKRVVTRDCLSNIQGERTDIPADTFEGCRNASSYPKLAVNVRNYIKEYDLQRKYYTQTRYCFCNLDHWCNGAEGLRSRFSLSFIMSVATSVLLITAFI